MVLRPLVEGGNGADADRTPQTSSVHRDPLLATKLYVLHPRTQHVNRSHLIERLQQGMERTFTLVSAPVGFGKTTLLAQWLAERRTVVAWLSLEAEDVVLVIEDRRSLVERFHSHSVF